VTGDLVLPGSLDMLLAQIAAERLVLDLASRVQVAALDWDGSDPVRVIG